MSLHYLKKPPYAPAFPWDSPEQVICSRYQRCRGCPYPSHGFLCWGRDPRMDRKGNPPPARPGTGWESAPYPPAQNTSRLVQLPRFPGRRHIGAALFSRTWRTLLFPNLRQSFL